MTTNISGNRGTISQSGNIMRVESAFVEEVSTLNRNTGYLIISYAAPGLNGITSVELLQLNVDRHTTILKPSGRPLCLCDIQEGMWVDSLFSPIMTKSIPPQSSAFLVVARREVQSPVSITTDQVAMVDIENGFLYTGDPNNINTQMKFVINNSTVILGRNGIPIPLQSLQPGQIVRVAHATFQTASIPPQTTAFHIQQF